MNRYKEDRPATWQTDEEPIGITNVISNYKRDLVIIDCISIWVPNILFDILGDFEEVDEQFDKNSYLHSTMQSMNTQLNCY